jgi:hypothetical protein
MTRERKIDLLIWSGSLGFLLVAGLALWFELPRKLFGPSLPQSNLPPGGRAQPEWVRELTAEPKPVLRQAHEEAAALESTRTLAADQTKDWPAIEEQENENGYPRFHPGKHSLRRRKGIAKEMVTATASEPVIAVQEVARTDVHWVKATAITPEQVEQQEKCDSYCAGQRGLDCAKLCTECIPCEKTRNDGCGTACDRLRAKFGKLPFGAPAASAASHGGSQADPVTEDLARRQYERIIRTDPAVQRQFDDRRELQRLQEMHRY